MYIGKVATVCIKRCDVSITIIRGVHTISFQIRGGIIMARLAFSATGDSAKGHDTFASPKKF